MTEKVEQKAPSIRFKGFNDDWEKRKLGDISNISRGASPRPIQNPKWFDRNSEIGWLRISDVTSQNGRIHYLEQRISKLGQEKTRVLLEPHLLLSIAATVGKPLVNYVKTGVHDGFLIFYDPKFDREFMFQWLDMFRPRWQKYGQPGSQVNLNSELVKNQVVLLPSMKEQMKISTFFQQLDNLLTVQQRKLDVLNQLKKALLQQMFPQNDEVNPRVRFTDFHNDWEQRKLNDGLIEYTDRIIVQDDIKYNQISVKNNFGGISLRGIQVGAKIGRKRQAQINLKIHPNTLIFTRQTIEQGGIGWATEDVDGAIVTENMPTIALNTQFFSKLYLTSLFQTEFFYRNIIMENIEGGSAQVAIHEEKILNSELKFPNIVNQERIGVLFQTLDGLINIQHHKLMNIKSFKKSLLQKMFI